MPAGRLAPPIPTSTGAGSTEDSKVRWCNWAASHRLAGGSRCAGPADGYLPACRRVRSFMPACPLRPGEMSQDTAKRPLLAAALSFLQPGLSHLYLREWLRACLWAGVWLGSLAAVVASARLKLSGLESLAAAFGVFPDSAGFPPEAALAMVAVTAFATLDAYWLTNRNNHQIQADTGRCRQCGEELDPTLEFCHWCTEPRDDDAA